MVEENDKKKEDNEVSNKAQQLEQALPDKDLEGLSGGGKGEEEEEQEEIDMPYMV